MISIAICDDEVKQRYLLKTAVEKICYSKKIPFSILEFYSGEAVLSSDIFRYDIVFLDIEMKGMNGIDTAREIRKRNKIVTIIFVTGFSDYVFDGYEVGARGYLMKPFQSAKVKELLEVSLEKMKTDQNEYYLLESARGIYKIPWTQILYFASDKRKVFLYTDSKQYEFYGKLDDLESFAPSEFLRIHKRYLVNLSKATGVEGSELLLTQVRLAISRQRRKETLIYFAKTMLDSDRRL